jgi:hypothetical protein
MQAMRSDEERAVTDTNGRKSGADETDEGGIEDLNDENYDAIALLDQLESLEEEMEELGVTTLDEVRQRIHDLHAKLGE